MLKLVSAVLTVAALAAPVRGEELMVGQPLLLSPPVFAGPRVVFASALSPQGSPPQETQLWSVNFDGADARALTAVGSRVIPAGVIAVTASPDGQRVVYSTRAVQGAPNFEDVHVRDLTSGEDRVLAAYDGCAPVAVTAHPAAFAPDPSIGLPGRFATCVGTPHISSDGSAVVYRVFSLRNPLVVVRAVGGAPQRLPVYDGYLAPAPQRPISRNGLVVFSSGSLTGEPMLKSGVFVMALDGSGLHRVADADLNFKDAAISDDGSLIAFSDYRTVGSSTAPWIHVVSSDGTSRRPLAPGTSPSISADGSVIAFLWDNQVWKIRSDGTFARRLTDLSDLVLQDAVISDDGLRIAFTVRPVGGAPGAVYAVNTDGSGLHLVYGPPTLNGSGVVGAASGESPSPGSLISLYGENLGPFGISLATAFPLPESLAGVSVLVNGKAVPILAVTPWQINAQLPPDTPEGPTPVEVRFAGGARTAAVTARVARFAPAPYTLPGSGYCTAAYHAGTATPVDAPQPAAPGEIVESYWSGLGRSDPPVAAGSPAPPSPLALAAAPELQLGSVGARVEFSGLAPGLAGVYQVNFEVPRGLVPGFYALRWRVPGGDWIARCAAVWVK